MLHAMVNHHIHAELWPGLLWISNRHHTSDLPGFRFSYCFTPMRNFPFSLKCPLVKSCLCPPLSTGKSWYSGSLAAPQPLHHNRTELHTINGYINGSLPGESWCTRDRDGGHGRC